MVFAYCVLCSPAIYNLFRSHPIRIKGMTANLGTSQATPSHSPAQFLALSLSSAKFTHDPIKKLSPHSAPFPISTSLLASNLLFGVNNPNKTLLTAVSFVISSGCGSNHGIFSNFFSYSTKLNLMQFHPAAPAPFYGWGYGALGQLFYLLLIVTEIVWIGHVISIAQGMEEGLWLSKARFALECPCKVVKFLPRLLGCQALRICGLPSLAINWRLDIGDRSALYRLLGSHFEDVRRRESELRYQLFQNFFVLKRIAKTVCNNSILRIERSYSFLCDRDSTIFPANPHMPTATIWSCPSIHVHQA